jgi:hypothetical protein
MFYTGTVEKNKTQFACAIHFFPENHGVEKSGRSEQAAVDNITRRMLDN